MFSAKNSRPLLIRVGFALTLIATLALFGIMSSVIIAQTLRGEASAINRAGVLRMHTYALSTDLLQPSSDTADVRRARIEQALDRFEAKYHSEVLTRAVPANPTDAARQVYEQIWGDWMAVIRPGLMSLVNGAPEPETFIPFRQRLDSFVADIDGLVRLLEQKTESKVQLLRFIQGLSLFLTVVVIFTTMYFLRTEVLQPLRDLLHAADGMRRRDFSRRVRHTGADELGQLGATFNLMAEDLSQTYEELEARVRDKTAALERTNRSLELMYRSLIHLHDTHLSEESYTQTLNEMERFLGLGRGSICMVEDDQRKGFQLAATTEPQALGSTHCALESCAGCLDQKETRLSRTRAGEHAPGERVLSVPLREGSRLVGLLTMSVPDRVTLEPWQIQLVEGVAQHLAIAMGKQRRTEQYHRLALLEERATIARELHDSLAQGLTYMKIQVSRLQGMLNQIDCPPNVTETVQDLRLSLNDAYRELRELLTTFRIRMDESGLNRALESSLREFAARGRLEVELDNRVADGELGVNAEIHVLQIVREALANVVKHAEARSAKVALRPLPEGLIRVSIEDDGHGMSDTRSKHGHYGLMIMHERARKLNSTLRIETSAGGGTRVSLDIDPHALRAESDEPMEEVLTHD
jgi:two-component system nitrate/nitrite sensor histidine kinase NarX